MNIFFALTDPSACTQSDTVHGNIVNALFLTLVVTIGFFLYKDVSKNWKKDKKKQTALIMSALLIGIPIAIVLLIAYIYVQFSVGRGWCA